MRVLGLTGGIGSGKTTVAKIFQELGVPVYIADEQAKALMNKDSKVRSAVIGVFGKEAYDQDGLNRRLLANKVFQDKDLLKKLNGIVHPAVGKDFNLWKEMQKGKYVVYEAAILFEEGGYKKCDKTLLLVAPHEVKVERIAARDNSSREEIEARMNNQWSDEEKVKLADFVISNTLLAETRKEVRKIHRIMLESA